MSGRDSYDVGWNGSGERFGRSSPPEPGPYHQITRAREDSTRLASDDVEGFLTG
jgi:hypothetical protein